MKEHRCPASIFRLFESHLTIAEGRKQAIEWLEASINDISIGDTIVIPDPETGVEIEFTKGTARC